jgi:probable rRNA maturation factor
MPDLVDLVAEDPRWEAAGLPALAERAARATLAHLGLPAEGFEISLLACGDARIAELNASFRGKAGPTNVLSWPSEERGARRAGARPKPPRPGSPDDPEALGDVALSFDTCLAEAGAAGRSLADHATHLVVHGVLHLLGYDHSRPADAALMERLEVEILARLGVADPYGGLAGA